MREAVPRKPEKSAYLLMSKERKFKTNCDTERLNFCGISQSMLEYVRRYGCNFQGTPGLTGHKLPRQQVS